MKTNTLSVIEMFMSLQGEGPRACQPAVFIRLAGCNMRPPCPFCDTNYTTGAKDLEDDVVVKEVLRWPQTNLVVVTGGEPFIQDFSSLCKKLGKYGKHIQIESNGMNLPEWYKELAISNEHSLSIVCSPKNINVDPAMITYAEAFKYIVRAGDLLEASGLPRGLFNPLGEERGWVGPEQIYLQPMDEQTALNNKANVQAAVASCLQHGYRLSLQQQKIIGCK